MPAEVRITGGDGLRRLAADLREVGGKTLQRQAGSALRKQVRPLTEAARQSAREKLPKSGGLNEWVAESKISPTVRLAGRSPSIRLRGTKAKHDLDSIDRGLVRHPVYNNRSRWASQSVTPGWWTEALERESTRVLQGLAGELNRLAADLNRRRY